MRKASKIVLRTCGLVFAVLCVLGIFWLGAHFTGSMPPSPWPMQNVQVLASSNAYLLSQESVDNPDIVEDMLQAPIDQHARIFREDEITIDRALRTSAAMRAEINTLPRYVLRGGDLLRSLSVWKHRIVAVLVETDGPRAVAQARSLWRHAVDAVDHCNALLECVLSSVMGEGAMLAAESVVARFDADAVPALSDLLAEVHGAFQPLPNLARAVEGEYHSARHTVESAECFSLDRVQTERIIREYYEPMHDYAEGTISAEAAEAFRDGPSKAFSPYYNLCGRALADVSWFDLARQIEEHRTRMEGIAARQRALVQP